MINPNNPDELDLSGLLRTIPPPANGLTAIRNRARRRRLLLRATVTAATLVGAGIVVAGQVTSGSNPRQEVQVGADPSTATSTGGNACAALPTVPKPPAPKPGRQQITRSLAGGSIVLAPPPTNARPTLSAAEAWAAAGPTPVGPVSPTTSTRYRINLASFTHYEMSASRPNHRSGVLLQHVLVWVIVGENLHIPSDNRCIGHSAGYSIINASTGPNTPVVSYGGELITGSGSSQVAGL
jgi:hypothetical protein